MKLFDGKTICEIGGIILLTAALVVLKVYDIVKLSWSDAFCPIIILFTVFAATAFVGYVVFLGLKIYESQSKKETDI